MDSPMDTLSPMSHEGYSADSQAVSEALAKNLSNLSLNPSIQFSSLPQNHSPQQQDRKEEKSESYGLVYRRRRGVRTMASLKRDLKGLFSIWLRRRNEAIQNRKKNKREPIIDCDCSDCRSNPGLSGIIKDYEAVLAALPKWKECQPED
uniref:Uncharacterized protein n=1 Tax=Pipistrellus kuhlii TaxID=59472 RepID=A0A7J7ZIT3_PIPKU|nr:hypothetical protein mPipKuh1_009406 [Pipistrellus kuhlii]